MEKRREWKETQFVAIQGRKSILLPTHPTTTAAGVDHKHNSNNDQEEEEEELVEKLYPERPEQQAVKLAATAISLNIRLKSADMPFSMQERALLHTTSQLRANSPSRRPNLTLLARSLKKEFDGVYGPAWHCVVGKSFGSFVTHTPGGFVYFSIQNNNQSQNQGSSSSPLCFLLFKTEVHLVNAKTPPLPLPASPCS